MDQMKFALIEALGLAKEVRQCPCGSREELKDGETRCKKCSGDSESPKE